MISTRTLFALLTASGGALSSTASQAQAPANQVTEIITSYRGFWRSGNGSKFFVAPINPIKPDNSHNLLAFTLGNFRFSTGVDNATLTARGLSYVNSQFQALPLDAITTAPTSNTKIALGQLKDGVDNGPSNPAPAGTIAEYLRDGLNGLDMGTGVANVPQGIVDFNAAGINPATVNDGNPDILVTQIADPGGASQDVYAFLDANNQIVGNAVTIQVSLLPVVGNWTVDFYEASTTPRVLGSGFTKTDRPLRLFAAEFTLFGITAANIGNIRTFRLRINGNSDLAFVAYNTVAAPLTAPLPVTLTSFTGQIKDTYSNLSWNTAQERNSAAFEVEYSATGRDFAVVGRVEAAGNSTMAQSYTFRHATSQAGSRYYRLRQIDLDGTSTYSTVVALTSAASATRITAVPNPFGNSLKLLVSGTSAAPATVQVELYTLTGRVVQRRVFERPGQSAALELTGLSNLPAGLYLARVNIDGQTTVVKVAKE